MVNYPNKKISRPRTAPDAKPDTARRGYSLEDMLNESNKYYLACDRAIIHKKPTPIQVVKVEYPRRSAARIVEAYYKIPSTTDYNGIYKGRYIDFEAKECHKKAFPFTNIHPHQLKHLEGVLRHGGIAFVIIAFTLYNEVYLVDGQYLLDFIKKDERRSLSFETVKETAALIRQGYAPQLDYLAVVDQWYFKED